MKIIEGMKHLRLLEKRMDSNNQRINQYSAMVSNERPYFVDDEAQRKEINALKQSNKDLWQEFMLIKRHIELTNLYTIVELSGVKYFISDLLVLRRTLKTYIEDTFQSMNDKEAYYRLSKLQKTGDTPLTVIRYYDENKKHEELNSWQELFNSIDSRLEVVNAVTDLMEE